MVQIWDLLRSVSVHVGKESLNVLDNYVIIRALEEKTIQFYPNNNAYSFIVNYISGKKKNDI